MGDFAKMMNENDEPAFPQYDYGNAGKGMTLRDWFAGQALSAMAPSWFGGEDAKLAASRAYNVADAMLAERAK